MEIAIILSPLLFSFIVQRIFPPNYQWYNSLRRSPYTPPNAIFGIVWTILYVMLGYILNRYIQTNNQLLIYILFFNFLVNFLWSPTFFYYQNPKLSLGLLGATLLSAILLFVLSTEPLVKTFLALYIGWLAYAFYLNAYIVTSDDRTIE